ncbi:uncharacterized protein TrAFT101_007981 [Trichoderma asperellum]|nr:hypothetical protein TrAFT101_007981 [Trichoderma asperellum]
MFKVHHEPGVNRSSLSGFLDAPGKGLELEHTTISFTREKSSSPSPSLSSSTSPSPSQCILADIPLDIFLEILDRLPHPWVISLALTCKKFYLVVKLFYQKKLALTDRDVASFTMTLQRDIPNVYCCVGCHKLCRLNPRGSWKDQGHRHCSGSSWWDWWDWCSAGSRFSKSEAKLLLWHPSTVEARIPFMDAYLVMNRHFYGSLHGTSLRTLERHVAFEKYIEFNDDISLDPFDWDDYWAMDQRHKCLKMFGQGVLDRKPTGSAAGAFERPWRFSFDYVPRIINDELYIARFHRIDGPMVSWKHFATLLSSIHLPLCDHLEFVAESHGGILIQHIDKPIPLLYVLFDETIIKKGGSCPDCFADYDFSLKRVEDKNEWSLRLSTYHCLGSCRSPSSGAWNHLHSSHSDGSHRCDSNCMEYGYHYGGRARRQCHESTDRVFHHLPLLHFLDSIRDHV